MKRKYKGGLPLVFVLTTLSILGCTTYAGHPVTVTPSKTSDICGFISAHFARSILEFERQLGPKRSSETVLQYGDPAQAKSGEVITARFADGISITYVLEPGSREHILEVEAKGATAWRKVGLDIQSVRDLTVMFGKPDWIEEQEIIYYGYGCEKFPESILQIDFDTKLLSIHEIASVN